MIPLPAGRIAEAVAARRLRGNDDATAARVAIDSRRCGAGDCFFAIAGEHHDGHDFVADAIGAGASVVVVEQLPDGVAADAAAVIEVDDTTAALQALARWLRHHLDPTVVGITGSLGKTTTKELAAELLRARHRVHATPGNLNNHWGLPLSLLGLEPDHAVMVAELAMSAAGEIRALARIAAPDVGVITNIAPAHMQNFADLDQVAAAKAELAEELPTSGTLIVNADDPLVDAMPARHAPDIARVVRFGRKAGVDVRADALQPAIPGWTFELVTHGESFPVRLQLAGEAGVACFLGAAAVAWTLGVEAGEIAERAATLQPLANRGGLHRINGITVLDESYNASPVAMKAALDTLATLPREARRIAVLGDMLEMGAWTAPVHREVGVHAARVGVDLLVAVGAFANLIVEGAVGAGMADDAAHELDSAEAAGAWLAPRLQAGDTLLVKGSRAVHLERVVEAITAAAAVTDAAQEG